MRKMFKLISILPLCLSMNCFADNLHCPSLAEIPANLQTGQTFTTASGTWTTTSVSGQPKFFGAAMLNVGAGIICYYDSTAIEQRNNTFFPVFSTSPKSAWYKDHIVYLCNHNNGAIDVSECPFSVE